MPPRIHLNEQPIKCKGTYGETYPASTIYFPEYEPGKIRGFCHACWADKKAAWYGRDKVKPENVKRREEKKANPEPAQEQKPTALNWTRPKPVSTSPLQADVLTLVEEIRALIGTDCRAHERLEYYLKLAAGQDVAVGRGALMMMRNDLEARVR